MSERAARNSRGRGPYGVRLGTVAGIEVRLDASIVLIFALIVVSLAESLFPSWHPDWSQRLFGEGGRLDAGSLKTFAKSIGLDLASFSKCFDERRHLESIFADRQEANRWGFHGTPGFILMQTEAGPTEKDPAIAIPGAFPFEVFAEEIDRMLSKVPGS